MKELDSLLLLSGNDIPFYEARIAIHQPTLKEIGYIGEENFFTGCEMFNFSKDLLSEEDRNNLSNNTDFDILIAILKERNAVMQKNRDCVEMVLALLFPEYSFTIDRNGINLKKHNEEEIHTINNDNFEQFKIIINSMFSYKKDKTTDLNPAGNLASKIAEKLRKRHQKLNQLKSNNVNKIDVLSRYVSILAVGQQKDINSLLNYTIYQLFDEFERYQLKISYDIFIQAKMAGAKDLKDVDDWMKDVHSKEE